MSYSEIDLAMSMIRGEDESRATTTLSFTSDSVDTREAREVERFVPHEFKPLFSGSCRTHLGTESKFMTEIAKQTVPLQQHAHYHAPTRSSFCGREPAMETSESIDSIDELDLMFAEGAEERSHTPLFLERTNSGLNASDRDRDNTNTEHGDELSMDDLFMTEDELRRIREAKLDGRFLDEPCVDCKCKKVCAFADPKDGTHSCDHCGLVQPFTEKISRNRNGGCTDESEDVTVRGDVVYGLPPDAPIRTKRDLDRRRLHASGEDVYTTNVPASMRKAHGKCISQSFQERTASHGADPHMQRRIDMLHTKALGVLERFVLTQPVSPSELLKNAVRTTIQQFVRRMVMHAVACKHQAHCSVVNLTTWPVRSIMLVCYCMCLEDCRGTQDLGEGMPPECSRPDVAFRMLKHVQGSLSQLESTVVTMTELGRSFMKMPNPELACEQESHSSIKRSPLGVSPSRSDPGMSGRSHAFDVVHGATAPPFSRAPFQFSSHMMSQRRGDRDSDDASSVSSRSTNGPLDSHLSPSPLRHVRSSSTLSVGSVSSVSTPTSPIPSQPGQSNRPGQPVPSQYPFKRALADIRRRNPWLAKHTITTAQAQLSNAHTVQMLHQLCISQKKSAEDVVLDYCKSFERENGGTEDGAGRESPTKRVRFASTFAPTS